jgi:hypothetical protein
MVSQNRTWLISAQKDKCHHADAIHELGFISWKMGENFKFTIGDIVYVYMSDEQRVRFMLRVEKENIKREDNKFCISLSPNDITYRLRCLSEYNGELLGKKELAAHGFTDGKSLEHPSCKESKYMNYIKYVFDSIAEKKNTSRDIMDRPMMVIDLFSGSYLNQYIGHEALNLEKNPKDGRYYGYCPPLDNIDITSLGADKHDEFISGVTVIYVQKDRGTNDRKVIAFCENAIVHNKSIIDKTLGRILDKKNEYCSYSIESDTLVNLMNVEPKFIIKINDFNNKMFRSQRFYKGKYPQLDKDLLNYIRTYLEKKDIDDDDASFQDDIQTLDETLCVSQSDTSRVRPDYTSTNNSLSVRKNVAVSKQALIDAKYICKGDSKHVTFENTKGKPYMEGHHLIPCTYANTKYFWETYGINIDCKANIVCLCPTCHRQIHYGSNAVKRVIIEKLYKAQKEKLESVGIKITPTFLLELYKIK